MKVISNLLNWLTKRLRPKPRHSSESFIESLTKAGLLNDGKNASADTINRARELGLDVEALIAEHERRKAASWRLDFSLDLAAVQPNDAELIVKLKNLGVPSYEIETHGKTLSVSVCGLYKRLTLPSRKMTVADVVAIGIAGIHERMAEAPEEFPAHRYPHGVLDWQLESLGWSEADQILWLTGTWKPEVRERLPSKLRPESSIDLRRSPFSERKLQTARPMSELKSIFLNVWRWRDGRHVVMDIFATEEACPAPEKSPHPEQADTLRMIYPSNALPELEWKVEWMKARTPAMDFLFRQRCQELGRPFDWLHAYSHEALFDDYETTASASDLRSSLQSGPTGPAPMPKGQPWPRCPCCGKPPQFSHSVDVRDIGFADLLPGTTMVIFACNECLDAGEWQNCSVVVWLRQSDEVVLIDQGMPATLVQRNQWHGEELINRYDLPAEIQQEVEGFEKTTGPPVYALPLSFGSKVGGVPAYLQTEEVFYDRDGLAMEYIAQISTPEHISAGGFGYVSYSAKTGETYIDFQDT